MGTSREKFATQVDTDLLAVIRQMAQAEGRQLQSLVEEAFFDLVEKRRNAESRPDVMAAYRSSHGRFGSLYKKLAK